MKNILVTVITACYNSGNFLEDAVLSVINQTYKPIQHIIIDGKSSDNTLEIIKKYQNNISMWISEPDSGYADAWNKGLRYAKGDIVGMLNADDMYHPDTVAKIVDAYKPDLRQIYYGSTRFFKDSTSEVINELEGFFNPGLICDTFGFMHTSSFVPKKIYNEIGVFDTKYKIAADTDFLFRCFVNGVAFTKGDYFTYMRIGGLSVNHMLRARFELYSQMFKYRLNKRLILKSILRFLLNYKTLKKRLY